MDSFSDISSTKTTNTVYLEPTGEVNGRDSADALSVQDNVLGGHAHPRPQGVPGSLDVRVQVLLARFT